MNNAMESMVQLTSCIEEHRQTHITITRTEGRTNQFFRIGTELRELVISKYAVDFEPISERDLSRRFNVREHGLAQLFANLLDVIENYRRLPRTLETYVEKDIWVDGTVIDIDVPKGTMTTKIGANPNSLKYDHDLWESTMKEIFVTDEAYQVARKQLMLYAFTNYREMPMIVFTGARGIGKNVWTRMLEGVFSSGTVRVDEDIIEGSWTSWMKNILIICDEAMPKSIKSYKTLKALPNPEVKSITEKYMVREQFRTNATVVVTSNDSIPFFTRAAELAKNQKNNQFYIYASPLPEREDYDVTLSDKLIACTVGYVRDVLWNEWQTFQKSEEHLTSRYGMYVPVTTAQTELFEANKTEYEELAEDFYERVCNDYVSQNISELFLKNDEILTTYFDEKINFHKMGKILSKCKHVKKTSKLIEGKTYRGYTIYF